MKPFSYVMPTRVVFGAGALAGLAAQTAHLGGKPLLVTGRHSARATGVLDRVLDALDGAVLFEDVPENPSSADAERGADRCREEGCDYVVGLGGGSPMDAAKAIALLAANPGTAADYYGSVQFQRDALPIAAIPTTAGTGSETTPYSVLVDATRHSKQTIEGPSLFPKLALLDPELSATMPRAVTVATGLDALSQGMEGMVSKKATPVGDTLALEICRIVAQWLPVAADAPEDIEARGWMLYAAMLSGCVIAQSGTTLVHGMGYYLTLECGVAHGLANGLLLAPVFRENARHEPGKVAAIAQALGADGSDPGGAVVRGLEGLFARLGLSMAAGDHGVEEGLLSSWAERLHADSSRFKNQAGDFNVDDVLRLFEAACRGASA